MPRHSSATVPYPVSIQQSRHPPPPTAGKATSRALLTYPAKSPRPSTPLPELPVKLTRRCLSRPLTFTPRGDRLPPIPHAHTFPSPPAIPRLAEFVARAILTVAGAAQVTTFRCQGQRDLSQCCCRSCCSRHLLFLSAPTATGQSHPDHPSPAHNHHPSHRACTHTARIALTHTAVHTSTPTSPGPPAPTQSANKPANKPHPQPIPAPRPHIAHTHPDRSAHPPPLVPHSWESRRWPPAASADSDKTRCAGASPRCPLACCRMAAKCALALDPAAMR
jgi:hypothetical protein